MFQCSLITVTLTSIRRMLLNVSVLFNVTEWKSVTLTSIRRMLQNVSVLFNHSDTDFHSQNVTQNVTECFSAL